MKVIIWIAESTWPATVDAATAWVPTGADLVLLHVTGDDTAATAHGAFAGLLGRHHPHERDPGDRVETMSATVAQELLAAAAARLAQLATRLQRHGRAEHEVVRAASGADLLVMVRFYVDEG